MTTNDSSVNIGEKEDNGKGRLASRLGFILISAGCAIGIGNVWRFPYIAGRSGGGVFLSIYLFILAIVGIPILTMEFSAGRAAQCSIAKLHKRLTPQKKCWRIMGVLGLLGNVTLMSFYTTVTSWMMIYAYQFYKGVHINATVETAKETFNAILSNPIEQATVTIAVVFIASFVCAFRVDKVLERVTKFMMLALIILILSLVVRSVLLPGAKEGINFLLVPNLERAKAIGLGNVLVAAMNQAFFTLSLGIGAMAIFGSYIGRKHTLFGEAVNVAALDTFVALAAGLVILPASFSLGVLTPEIISDQSLSNEASGPGLVFITLPEVFARMAGGRIWGIIFFIFMSFAALSTVFAVFETIIASLIDYLNWTRPRVCILATILLSILSLACVFGFNIWSNIHPLGGQSTILDLEDFITSNIILPIGSLGFVLYCTHRFGWGWKNFLTEVNQGKGISFPNFARFYCAYIIPLIILIIFIQGLI